MSFKTSSELVYGVNSAVIDLTGFSLVVNNPEEGNFMVVEDPKVVVDLLSPQELKRYVDLTNSSLQNRVSVEHVLVRDKVTEVLGYTGKYINIGHSPAGIISTIAGLIFSKSFLYLKEPEKHYDIHASNIFFLDQMCGIISYYMNTPYDTVKNLPINEIFKRHAICQEAFPSQISSLSATSEEA